MNILRLHRLKAGTHTAAALAADGNALVSGWPTTLTSGGWIIAPGLRDESSRYIVKKYAARVMAHNGQISTVGRPHDAWRIARMDDTMWEYLITILTSETTAVTFYTPDRQKSGGAGWVTYNALAHRPAYEELKTYGGLWYADTPIRFTQLAIAASGA